MELPDDTDGGAFEALAAANLHWLGRYARLHPSFGVEPSLLERHSLWMNAFFQKSRMVTSPASAQAKALLRRHRDTVSERLRWAPTPHAESPFCTTPVEPMAALMFAASVDRCPHGNLEALLAEAWELLQCTAIRSSALQSGFAGCIYRFLTEFTEPQKRIPCLRLLVLLAEEDTAAVVNACKVAAQGQFWEPNMFVLSLQKRHKGNSELCELASKLITFFADVMPIPQPIVLERPSLGEKSPHNGYIDCASPPRSPDSGVALPQLATKYRITGPPFSPTTTISKLYQEAPSPYCPNMLLPLTRPPTSPLEQSRRAKIFSMPKLAAVDGQRRYRCSTPNSPISYAERNIDDNQKARNLDAALASPPQSPGSPSKPRVNLSEKYSWNPECINSVSGFEWWWRSLPQNHTNLEPTQKLKMVTKAAVRLHSKGELQRAIELYLFALSSNMNGEVKFRLRVNLACAYESAEDISSSIAEFRGALELNPGDPYAIYKLGSALTAVGEFEEARTHFEAIIHEYPQAAEGLKTLEKAQGAHQRGEEARKAAIAAAKVRRSPLKVISPRVFELDATPREPVAPSTPVLQSPAPHRKKRPTAKREHPAVSVEPNEYTNAPAKSPNKVSSPQNPETANVATLTDHVGAPNLLDLLVKRCQETGINMMDVIRRLDPQHRGLIHKESFISFLRVMTGAPVPHLDDSTSREVFGIQTSDWVTKDGQDFFVYDRFVDTYAAAYRAVLNQLSTDEILRMKQQVDELVRNDVGFVSNRSVSEWVRLGTARAHIELNDTSSASATKPENALENCNPSRRESNDETSAQHQARQSKRLPDLEGDTRDAPDESIITPRTRVRKEKAREEWLLTAEKARVLARRQQHCIKSLRDIAARARTHVASRRRAISFLVGVAQNAREELTSRRLRLATAQQEDPMEPETTNLMTSAKELSEQTYKCAVQKAMGRLGQIAGLEDVKTVAAQFAAFCQVPIYFLAVHRNDSGEGALTS